MFWLLYNLSYIYLLMDVYSLVKKTTFQVMAAKVVSRILPQVGISPLEAKYMSRDPVVVSQFV